MTAAPPIPGLPLTFEFRGTVIGDFFNALGATLLSVLTFGIAVPWAQAMRYRWVCQRTYVNGIPMRFTGSGGGLFGHYIKWWLLCVITLGIYSIWVGNRLRQWAIKHQTAVVPLG